MIVVNGRATNKIENEYKKIAQKTPKYEPKKIRMTDVSPDNIEMITKGSSL